MADTTWFSNDRFDMFIHWGLYSTPAGVWRGEKIARNYSEWLQASETVPRAEYRKLAELFNPSGFDAEAWIREAKNAGMRYFLITAKHHDGFCLWPIRVSDYNVMEATPFKRDILGELATACRKYELKLGFYYSHWMDTEPAGHQGGCQPLNHHAGNAGASRQQSPHRGPQKRLVSKSERLVWPWATRIRYARCPGNARPVGAERLSRGVAPRPAAAHGRQPVLRNERRKTPLQSPTRRRLIQRPHDIIDGRPVGKRSHSSDDNGELFLWYLSRHSDGITAH